MKQIGTVIGWILFTLFVAAALLGWLIGRLVWLAKLIIRHGIRGEHRAAWAPVWLLAAGSLSVLLPGAEYWWCAVAAAVAWLPDRWWGWRDRVWLSERERVLGSRAVALITLNLTTGTAGATWWVVLLLHFTVAMSIAVPWWRGRRKRPAEIPLILQRWTLDVVPVVPQLAGTWVEYDDAAGMGVLQLTAEKASVAAKLDEDAEWALHQPRGTVTISADPRLSVRCVRVAFTQPGDGGRMRYWDGPSLDKNGWLRVAVAHGEIDLKLRLKKPSGVLHGAIIGASGSGKGVLQRLLILETAIHPEYLNLGACGKGGKGLGYVRSGMAFLATRPDEWLALFVGIHNELTRREQDPTHDDDSFVARPGVPQIVVYADEMKHIIARWPQIAFIVEAITDKGRSLGISLIPAGQKGTAPTYGSTDARNNIIGNGWLAAGVADDLQAKNSMTQGWDWDPACLPAEEGWFGFLGRSLGAQATVPGRVLFIPNRLDVRMAVDKGMTELEAAPFGTCEDWLESKTVHPELLPAAEMALGLVSRPDEIPADAAYRIGVTGEDGRPRLDYLTEDQAMELAQQMVDQPGDSGGITLETALELMLASGALEVLTPDDLSRTTLAAAPAPVKKEAPGWKAIKECLREAEEPMTRGEIAKVVELSPRRVSELLGVYRGREVEVNEMTSQWRLIA